MGATRRGLGLPTLSLDTVVVRDRRLWATVVTVVAVVAVLATLRFGPSPSVICPQLTGMSRWWYESGFGGSHIDGATANWCDPPANSVFWLVGTIMVVAAWVLVAIATLGRGRTPAEG